MREVLPEPSFQTTCQQNCAPGLPASQYFRDIAVSRSTLGLHFRAKDGGCLTHVEEKGEAVLLNPKSSSLSRSRLSPLLTLRAN